MFKLKIQLNDQKKQNAAATARQARALSSQLVVEYAKILSLSLSQQQSVEALDWLTTGKRPANLFPELDLHSKILEVRPNSWGEGRPRRDLNMQEHRDTRPSLKVGPRSCSRWDSSGLAWNS